MDQDPPRPNFYLSNARWLAAGLLCTLGSSFGQTFFISLFADQLMELHGLTAGTWGSLYAGATLTSAAMLIKGGQFADTMRLRTLAMVVVGAFALVCAGMALHDSIVMLFLMVLGLRFFGQGMISHVGMTATARWFQARRGRAIAITSLGYGIGEAVLPATAVLAIALVGWRGAWWLAAATVLLVFGGALWVLFARDRTPQGGETSGPAPGALGRHWTRPEALRHWSYWALFPGILTPAFIGTVVFFHQAHVSGEKGWSLAEMAAGYPAYAFSAIAAVFIAGRIIDRFGALALLPLFLLPIGLGIVLLQASDEVWIWGVVLGCIGFGSGFSSALNGAVWAEIYGTRNLGAIRALAVSAMVFSTAIGPAITGLLIDRGIVLETQGIVMMLWCVGLSAVYVQVAARLRGLIASAA
ncbi:MAG: MFS transporter [Nisaea sp.]|uniref:MFS transporter n=1 Tax=Nisaea sp. TaxID=2024842 RepID=UPI001B2EEB2C|nr:MFS transporter [Nisaea sp.]MBO6560941.1 MFS transporter [Nisaea sp.]